MPNFTEDSVQRIIINPFYAISVAVQLTRAHEPTLGESEWVRVNAALIDAMGGGQWFDVLEGKAHAAEQPINPFQAVTIDPLFATPHPPLIEREMWIDVNLKQMRNIGVEEWLRQLLDVLGGDVVTAGEVGLAPEIPSVTARLPARPDSSGERRNGRRGTTGKI